MMKSGGLVIDARLCSATMVSLGEPQLNGHARGLHCFSGIPEFWICVSSSTSLKTCSHAAVAASMEYAFARSRPAAPNRARKGASATMRSSALRNAGTSPGGT